MAFFTQETNKTKKVKSPKTFVILLMKFAAAAAPPVSGNFHKDGNRNCVRGG
jgi:hypothetical protein